MKRRLLFGLIFMVLISIFLISADFDVGDKSHEVTIVYGPGDDLQGWINISLDDEPVSSFFKDNEDNLISLIDLLRSDTYLTEGVDYNCSIPGCGVTYSAYGGNIQKTFSLNAGEEKVIGFKLVGEPIEGINNINFNITSDAGSDCTNQLEIDFFADGEIDYINDKLGIGNCPQLIKKYGCFNSSKYEESGRDRNIEGNGNMYCQKIKLSKSPGFKIGAWLKISSEEAKKTNISIYDVDFFTFLDGCELNNIPIEGEVNCEVNLLVKKSKEYYVCIFGKEDDANTKIKSYFDLEEGCGFHYTGSKGTENYAYSIFAEAKKFGPVGTINIRDEDFYDDGLGSEFHSYIKNEYGDSCLGGCIIPIKINSKKNQNITIKNISGTYDSGGTIDINKVWDLTLTSATVTTGDEFIQISLSNGGFTLPTEFDSFDYDLDLNKKEIFKDEALLIERVPKIKYLTPVSAFNKIPINFKVSVDEIDNASIVSYVWQFGNATPQPTTTNSISHTFQNEGPFPVKITVTDTNGKKASKTFNLIVYSYILYFDNRVGKVIENVANIESQLTNFSSFFQEGIKETIDTAIIRQQIADLQIRNKAGEYESVVSEFLILETKVPESVIEKISTSSVSYYPNLDYVELGIVSEVFGGSYDITKTSAYKDAILNWHVENLDSKVKYNQVTAEYENGRSEPILNVFELDLRKTGIGNGTIFIRELENIKFDRAYGEQVKLGYVYISLGSGKKIKFYTTQDVGITNLPIFISPALSELTIIEEFDEAEEKRMRWVLFILIIFFLLIVGIIVYIILQQWYKHKYETYLFKNRNFLFNLINYIDAQKKKGVKDRETFSKLKKAGWNSEQINYVIRKYLGKRTGMLEIPVEKVLRMFRKRGVQQAGVPSAPGPRGLLPRGTGPRKGFFKNS